VNAHIPNVLSLNVVVILAMSAFAAQPRLMGAGEALSLHVTPTAAMAPTAIRIRAIVEPDSKNRALEVSADSGIFLQGSRIELDGEAAPRVNEVVFRDMPSGAYEIAVRLLDSSGRVLALVRNTVVVEGGFSPKDGSSGSSHGRKVLKP